MTDAPPEPAPAASASTSDGPRPQVVDDRVPLVKLVDLYSSGNISIVGRVLSRVDLCAMGILT
jgi:hypothetical protein